MFVPGSIGVGKIHAAFARFKPPSVAESVSIPSDPGVVLAGTLRTPIDHGPGPFPLVIFIQGHGRNGRGGFNVLMDRLLADGIATLEYDKRGIGQSTGTYVENLDALTRDAEAAAKAMRRRADIDGSRIAIAGHSQGGAIAPAVAVADPRIAAIVAFAGGPIVDGSLDQLRGILKSQLITLGWSESTVKPVVDASTALIQARITHSDDATIKQLQAAVVSGFAANGFTPEQARVALAGIDNDEAYQFLRFRLASELRSLRIPVLELFGSLDPLVPAKTNAPAARNALAGNPAGEVVVFDGLSHSFQEGAKTGSAEEAGTLGPNIGSPRVVKLVGDWLDTHLHPAKAITSKVN
jgi:pimeloyl-ACP methyl ester carboxylesterase